jgi:hypothetical protein
MIRIRVGNVIQHPTGVGPGTHANHVFDDRQCRPCHFLWSTAILLVRNMDQIICATSAVCKILENAHGCHELMRDHLPRGASDNPIYGFKHHYIGQNKSYFFVDVEERGRREPYMYMAREGAAKEKDVAFARPRIVPPFVGWSTLRDWLSGCLRTCIRSIGG